MGEAQREGDVSRGREEAGGGGGWGGAPQRLRAPREVTHQVLGRLGLAGARVARHDERECRTGALHVLERDLAHRVDVRLRAFGTDVLVNKSAHVRLAASRDMVGTCAQELGGSLGGDGFGGERAGWRAVVVCAWARGGGGGGGGAGREAPRRKG